MKNLKIHNESKPATGNIVTKPKDKKNNTTSKMRTKITRFSDYSKISTDANFIKNLRIHLTLNRTEASKVLGMSTSSIKRYETGINNLTMDKLDHFLSCYCISRADYMSFKAGKELPYSDRKLAPMSKVIENNSLRRSYKKIITNEVKTLIHLRKIRGLNQYQLTARCGWSRTAINHIESGRITLTEKKLKLILKNLGFTLKKFKQHLDSPFDRTIIEKKCIQKILELDSKKLKSIESILENF